MQETESESSDSPVLKKRKLVRLEQEETLSKHEMAGEDLEKDLFKNWVRGAKGLEYLQEGLQDFVGDKVQHCRNQVIQKIINGLPTGYAQQCSQCTSENLLPEHAKKKSACNRSTCIEKSPNNCFGSKRNGRRKCPNGICSKLYDEIVLDHTSRDPMWKNTDPSTWCSDPLGWSFGKCFQTTTGPGISASTTDASGLLSILINNLTIQNNWLACKDMSSQITCPFNRARDIRNAILHSSKLELDEPVLGYYLDTFMTVLQDAKCLLSCSKHAVDKLLQLKNQQININQKDETRLVRNRKEALSELEEKTAEGLREIDDRTATSISTFKHDVDNKTKTALSDIEEAKGVAEQNIKDNTKAALSELEEARKGAAQGVSESTKAALSDLEEAKKKSSQDIKESTKGGLSKLEEAKKGAQQEVKESVKDALSEVEKAKKGAAQDVKESTNAAMFELEEAKKGAAHDIKERTKAVMSELEEAGKGIAQHVIKSTKSELAEDLKEDLIALYREEYYTLPLSPLIEERETLLLKFYVMPVINSVEIQSSFGGGNEIKSEVTSLRDVFYKRKKSCRKVYLTAEAGLGKTAFSKLLVLTWCHAKKRIKSEKKFFKEEDIQTMSEFKFVFLLSLRDCTEECDIDEMIMKKMIPRLAHTSVTVSDIETILSEEKCLVILDGLDEWVHPTTICKLGPSDIPHRKARDCTILTTSRPWKLSVISLSSSKIDRKLELLGLNITSAKELKTNVISLLCAGSDKEKQIQDFNTAVANKGILGLETSPLLLMYLLCLWCDGVDLGRSKCELYCQIVELLLKRTFKKYRDMQQARESPRSDIPQYFSEHVYCRKYYPLLKALGQLAFETLLYKKRESTLVFQTSIAEKCLNTDTDYLKLCFLSGILTQSKEEKLTSQSSKVSFSHKTVQEYFCAQYISCQNESDIRKLVQQNLSSLQNILDISKVFVFISGMNAEVMSSISRELMPVISEDQITRTYRSMVDYDYRYVNPLKDIQNMYISCLKENTDNTSLCLQDVFLDRDYREEKHFLNLKWLATHNKSNMQSILIRTGVHSLHELLDQFELDNQSSVKKIHYVGECKEAEIIRLFTNKSLECVNVSSVSWQELKIAASEVDENINSDKFQNRITFLYMFGKMDVFLQGYIIMTQEKLLLKQNTRHFRDQEIYRSYHRTVW